MATEKIIKGKRSRCYKDGYIWVCEDGTVVAVKQKNGSQKYLSVKTDGNGEKYVQTGYQTIYVKKAVFICFYYCNDPNKTQIWYKDGNPANLRERISTLSAIIPINDVGLLEALANI